MDAPLPGRSYTRADLVGQGFSASLVSQLEQPADPSASWGATRSLFWSIITFGLLPAIWWPIKFRQNVLRERKLIARLSDWLRAQCSHSESALLRNSDEEITTAPILAVIPLLICAGLVCSAVSLHMEGRLPHLNSLLSHTYWHRQLLHGSLFEEITRDIRDQHLSLFSAWSLGLAVSFLCHGIQVRAHRASMVRYLCRVNRVLTAEGLKPIEVRPNQPASGVPWLLAIGCLWYVSALWGVFAMLAGAGQYRYMNRTGPAIREALARSVGELSLRAALPMASASRCPRERCRAPVRPGAHFCGRCGTVLQV